MDTQNANDTQDENFKITNDIECLQESIIDIQNEIQDALLINSRLRNEAEFKIHELTNLDIAKAKEYEDCENKLSNFKSSSQQTIEDLNLKVSSLLLQKQEHSNIISAFETIQYENESLKNTQDNLSNDLQTLTENMHANNEQIKQKGFDAKMDFDKVMRSTINDFAVTSKNQSLNDMKKEVQESIQHISKTAAEYNSREKKCLELVEKQKKSFDRHSKLKIASSLVNSGNQLQEQRIEELTNQIDKLEIFNTKLAQEIDLLKLEVDFLQKQLDEKTSLLKKMSNLESQYHAINHINQSKKEVVIKSAKHFLKKCARIANNNINDNNNTLNETVITSIDSSSNNTTTTTTTNNNNNIKSGSGQKSMLLLRNINHNNAMDAKKRGGLKGSENMLVKSLRYNALSALENNPDGMMTRVNEVTGEIEIDYSLIWKA